MLRMVLFFLYSTPAVDIANARNGLFIHLLKKNSLYIWAIYGYSYDHIPVIIYIIAFMNNHSLTNSCYSIWSLATILFYLLMLIR